jgi:N-acetyl-anhydromuramyl-L-alanine amidase AmpD
MANESFPITGSAEELIPDEATQLSRKATSEYMSGYSAVRYLVLHCSATRVTSDYTAEQLERDHKKRGFRTVGYHFYIRKDGTVTKHRGLLEVGAHCKPYNRCSIGICYEGGLDANGTPADTRTPAQTEQIQLLLMRLHKLFPKAHICGHRDLPSTTPKACPCFDAAAVFGFIE